MESPYGAVKLNNEKITSVEEKPKYKFFANAGVYVLDPKCIDLISKKFYNMTSLFKKIILKKYNVVSFPIGEFWLDIGRPNDYKKAIQNYNLEFKK